jgi:glycosyltransferase involved in cell wall biosynthesis
VISIIIPTLNEVHFLKKGIKDLLNKAQKPDSLQILVVDAGSDDKTLESVGELDVLTFSNPSFRFKKYESLNFGIQKAKGDYLLFLDADTILPKHFDLLISEKLSDEKIVGGAFEFAFSTPNWKFKIIEFLNRIRYRFSQVYYGDQALFCRIDVAIKVGGFPEKRLMEAAYFCEALKKEGQLSLIKSSIKTSPRRFLDHGFYKVCWFDVVMWVRFALKLSVDNYGERYWKVNLKSNE